jgi:hypothetical protein
MSAARITFASISAFGVFFNDRANSMFSRIVICG